MKHIALVCSLVALHCYGAGVPPEAARFEAETKMVLIPTTVLDKRGTPVTGLGADAFAVKQDNRPQNIVSFGEQDLPASIGVVFDVSGSMGPALAGAKEVLKLFFAQCNPEDESFIYTVSTKPGLDSEFTSDFDTLLAHSSFTASQGATALTDTVLAAVRKSRLSHNLRKALLIVSDGMDNHSRYSRAELMSAAVEADLQIYSISLFSAPANKKGIELQEERQGIFFLEELSRRTGGIQFVVQKAGDMEKAAVTVGRAIRNQYVIGYAPAAAARDDKWHRVQVLLTLPGATVYSRPGFFAK